MRFKNWCLSIGFFFSSVSFFNVSAQVSIGSPGEPVQGALLQLKQWDTEGANSNKGMIMPRIKLTVKNQLDDIIPDSNERPDPAKHTGLLVYSISDDDIFCPGLYVWTGEAWQPLREEKLEYFTDTRTKADGTIESITYPMRRFGDAGVWMLQNLRATTYADNLGVTKPADDLSLRKGVDGNSSLKGYYFPGSTTTSTFAQDQQMIIDHPEWGLHYLWNAATRKGYPYNKEEGEGIFNGNPPVANNSEDIEQVGVQGVCPDGWHLPSDKEWSDLEKAIANEQTGLYTVYGYKSNLWNDSWRIAHSDRDTGSNGHGRNMRSSSAKTINGLLPEGKSTIMCRGGGFNALMVGRMITNSTDIQAYGNRTSFWSSSAAGNSSWVRYLYSGSGGVTRSRESRTFMNSVRCKRNN